MKLYVIGSSRYFFPLHLVIYKISISSLKVTKKKHFSPITTPEMRFETNVITLGGSFTKTNPNETFKLGYNDIFSMKFWHFK